MEDLILVLDDSPSCQKIATESLKKLAQIKAVSTIGDARDFLSKNAVRLVILDIGLPDGDGLEFYSEMQTKLNHIDTPVVVISGSDDICKKITAFSYGAEDYIVKPYSPMELRARIERVFRTGKLSTKFKDPKSQIALDFSKFKAMHVTADKETDLMLTPHEFKILSLFLKNPETVYSREQILDTVWGRDIFLTPRTVDTHISSLRKKIAHLSVSIITIRGDGYKSEIRIAA